MLLALCALRFVRLRWPASGQLCAASEDEDETQTQPRLRAPLPPSSPPTPTPTCCWHCLDQRLSLYNPSALFGPGSFSTSHTVGSALLVRRRPRLAPSSLLVNPFQLLAAPPALHEPKASPPLTDTDTQCCTSSLLHPWATVQCSAAQTRSAGAWRTNC